VLIGVAIVCVGLVVILFVRATEFATADEAQADAVWQEIRGRFANARPVLEMRAGETAVLSRDVPASPAERPLQSLHIAAWDRDDRGLFRMTVPFWLLRFKSGAITIGEAAYAHRLDITPEQLERFGPALLVDHEAPGGDRVLVWTE
jgi:hypothetical protein